MDAGAQDREGDCGEGEEEQAADMAAALDLLWRFGRSDRHGLEWGTKSIPQRVMVYGFAKEDRYGDSAHRCARPE
jgi:hypothetical protein